VVEAILDEREGLGGKSEFLVKWRGYLQLGLGFGLGLGGKSDFLVKWRGYTKEESTSVPNP